MKHRTDASLDAPDIYKAAGVIIIDRQVLATRSIGKSVFVNPGGKLEWLADENRLETELEALVRELREELDIGVEPGDVEKIDDFYADEAAGQPGKTLKMATFLVKQYSGEITPMNEIEEVRLFGSVIPGDVEIGSILVQKIIPWLKNANLID